MRIKDETRSLELVFILDESGSMFSQADDTVGGFNAMIERQRRAEIPCLVTTVLFSDEARRIHDRLPLDRVPPLTREEYEPRGCTALYDAIGAAVEHVRDVHRYVRPEDVPDRTLVVITTDGMENASRRFGARDVKRLVERSKEEGWEFLFLGANMDAITAAGSIGIEREKSVTYRCDSVGTRLNFTACSKAIKNLCAEGRVSPAWKEDVEKYEKS